MVKHIVVIIEDDEAVRSSLQLLAEALGWHAYAFASGPACLDAVRDGLHPDCFLLDLNMPEMTGPEVQQILARVLDGVPVIAMTAEPQSPLVQRMLHLGARDVLHKPFDIDELELALERSVSRVH